MSSEFQSGEFLSHSAKDKAVVRPLAERLLQPLVFSLQPFPDAPSKEFRPLNGGTN